MKLKIGELCAGYGGLGLAVEEVFDAELAWVSEFEEAPSKILAHHWPDVPNHGDMTTMKWAPDCPTCGERCAVFRHSTDNSPFYWCSRCEVEWDISIRFDDPDADRIPEPVEIASGGTPCQDLSHAGRRAGMTDGTRSNLWVQMREAIATIRPTYVVWENVRGAYSAEADSSLEQCPGCMGDPADRGTVLRALGRVLGDLSDLGYDCQWRGLRAADVGAPHGRFRVFILATHRDHARRGEQRRTLAVQEEHPATEYPCADVPDALRGGSGRRSAEPKPARGNHEAQRPGEGGNTARDVVADAGGETGEQRPRLCESDQARVWRGRSANHGSQTASTLAPGIGGGEGWAEHARLQGRPDAQLGSDAPSADAGDAAGNGERARTQPWEGSETDWGEYEPAIRRWEATLGRRAPAPTEPTGRDGGHRLSARFAEWMMGVPDGWIVDVPGISRNEALKAAGNGVVPQQAAAALRDMLNHSPRKEVT